MIKDGLICEVLTGSQAYGTSLPTSDRDTRGIFVAPEICIRTPFFIVREVEDKTKEDTKFYELTNFMKLLVDQNPNILEIIWCEAEDILFTSPTYEYLRANRYNLLSSKLAHTFSGYAHSQLLRIKGHNKWINNPQSIEAPQQKDFMSVVFNMTGNKKWNKTVPTNGFIARDLGSNMFALYCSNILYTIDVEYNWCDRNGVPLSRTNEFWSANAGGFDKPDLLIKLNIDQFQSAHENWKNYWTWKKNRNEVRSALEEQFGFDCKHAMHLIRLLKMGKEALTDEIVLVKRPDAQELLDIRHGKFTYEEIVQYAEQLDAEVKALYETTSLPRAVDPKFAAKLLMQLQDMEWGKERP